MIDGRSIQRSSAQISECFGGQRVQDPVPASRVDPDRDNRCRRHCHLRELRSWWPGNRIKGYEIVTTQNLRKSRHRRSSIALIVAGLLVAVVPIAAAQTGGAPVASGEFSGFVGLDGGFRLDIPEGGDITVFLNGSGPLDLTLADGTMTGNWSLDATQTLEGTIGPASAGISMTGGGPIHASGEMSGPPGDYRMTGTYSQTNTATIVTPIATRSSTAEDSGAVDVALNDVLVLCDQIVGRWDYQVKQDLEGAGFDEFVRGYFSASTGIDATEQATEVEALVADINAWASSAPSVEEGGRSLYIGMGLALLNAAQRLQAELAAPTPCPPDPTFMTDLALAAQDALSNLIGRYRGITNPAVVALGLGSGAIGEGSPAGESADALEAQMDADIEAHWEDAIADENFSEAEIVDIAQAAQMLGKETLGTAGLSPGDVLLVFGVSS